MQIQHEMPWHTPVWQQLGQAIHSQRLPHALLLTGPAGVGKRRFASRLSELLLCRKPDLEALKGCGQCDACHKASHGAHPDYRRCTPQEGKREIVVEDIRNLLKFIQLSPQVSAGYKIASIEPADAMNRNAANALLKTLEEPPARRLIILTTDSLGRISATIRSRCRILRFGQPSNELAMDWLMKESGRKFDISLLVRQDYSVLGTLEVLQDEGGEQQDNGREVEWRKQWQQAARQPQAAIKLAEQWADFDEPKTLMRWLLRENIAATRSQLGATHNPDTDMFTQAGIRLEGVMEIHNKINELLKASETTLNARLLWETFLLDCHRIATGKPD